MPITQNIGSLGTPPSTSDPLSFASRADELLGTALPARVTEMNTWAGQANALASAVNALATQVLEDAEQVALDRVATGQDRAQTGLDRAAAEAAALSATTSMVTSTSTTSLAIGTGSKTFSTQAGKQYSVGVPIIAVDQANAANYMAGTVTAYSGTSLEIAVTDIGGSGTKAAWNISVAGVRGAPGALIGTATGAINEIKGSNIASAATVNLDTATGNLVHITGTTTITAITLASGAERDVVFDGVLTLTHHATTLILPGGANITTAAGDRATFRGDGAGNVRCMHYTKASGQAVVAPTVAAGLTCLATATVSSAVATVDFTQYIDSTYDEYIVEFFNVVPDTVGATFRLLASTNGGASFMTDGYGSGTMWCQPGGTPSGNSGGTASILIGAANGASTTVSHGGYAGTVKLFNLANTAASKLLTTQATQMMSATNTYVTAGSGSIQTNSAINAIRFAFNTGLISAGTFKLYGVRKAV
ncbi:hypothetical protein [Noviherbaspirillum sp. Root189]|uniref:hypothetical protein n=1 Tax=Noviherbaspirillum sp. Root189 TaxID=1736487 RepID=UPI00070D0AD2|nr:hypothetical protein [Noviherbaspirillum sp. Root189]KRB73438.1 hypothetical protein ASE07_06190 [Noviherbaspirillum sp. Root189]